METSGVRTKLQYYVENAQLEKKYGYVLRCNLAVNRPYLPVIHQGGSQEYLSLINNILFLRFCIHRPSNTSSTHIFLSVFHIILVCDWPY